MHELFRSIYWTNFEQYDLNLQLKETLTWSEVTANMKRKRDYWVSLFPLARNEKKEKDLARERKLLKEFTAILYCWIELCSRD